MLYITYPTDTGSGRKRNYKFKNQEYKSISNSQQGPFPPDSNLNDLIIRAKENNFQVIVKTSKNTYYLKCKKNEVSLTKLLDTLVRNSFLKFRKKSITYLLI